MISSGRRIQVSTWHWGSEAPRQEVRGSWGLGPGPPVGSRGSALLGFQGAKAAGAKWI